MIIALSNATPCLNSAHFAAVRPELQPPYQSCEQGRRDADSGGYGDLPCEAVAATARWACQTGPDFAADAGACSRKPDA